MTLLEAIIYGIIQGLTEFLPVSSSGHLAIAQIVFGGKNPDELLAFNVLLHFGTLLAVFIAYYKDILPLFPAFFRLIGKIFRGKFKYSTLEYNEKMIILLIIPTLLLVPCALFLEDKLGFIQSYLAIIGAILIFNGFILWFSDKLSKETTSLEAYSPMKALFVGAIQALASLFPGLSRSGSTITGGLLSGLSRENAVKYSFLMSLPAVAGACVYKLPGLFSSGESANQFLIYIAGAAVSAIVGIGAIKLLRMISRKNNFRFFAYYCVAIGIGAIVYDIIV